MFTNWRFRSRWKSVVNLQISTFCFMKRHSISFLVVPHFHQIKTQMVRWRGHNYKDYLKIESKITRITISKNNKHFITDWYRHCVFKFVLSFGKIFCSTSCVAVSHFFPRHDLAAQSWIESWTELISYLLLEARQARAFS